MLNDDKVLSKIYDKNILNIISNRNGFDDLYSIFGSFTKAIIYAMATRIITVGMKWSFEDIALICDLTVLEVEKNYYEAEKVLNDCWYQAKYLLQFTAPSKNKLDKNRKSNFFKLK